MVGTPKPLIPRLHARSRKEGECLIWHGHRTPKEYGIVSYFGRLTLVHRAAWIERHGPIPTATPHVLHRCDNPPCWADEHLYLGTNDDNVADKVRRGRTTRGLRHRTCRRGHDYDEANTYIEPDGSRQCRACRRLAVQRHRTPTQGDTP